MNVCEFNQVLGQEGEVPGRKTLSTMLEVDTGFAVDQVAVISLVQLDGMSAIILDEADQSSAMKERIVVH